MVKINAVLFLSLSFSLFRFPLQLNKYFIFYIFCSSLFHLSEMFKLSLRNTYIMNVMYICVLNAFSKNKPVAHKFPEKESSHGRDLIRFLASSSITIVAGSCKDDVTISLAH